MRILVYGAGAIGQWIAGRLTLAGEDVAVLCRREAHAAIRARGIRVFQAWRRDAPPLEASGVQAVDSVEGAAALPPFDWILITVKTFDVARALDEIAAAGLAGGTTRLMGLQNGVGTEDLVADRVGGERTGVCVVTKPIGLGEAPGDVLEASPKGGLGIAPYLVGGAAGQADLLRAMRRTGLSVVRFNDYRAMKWSKLLLNMTANALCAILDVSAADVYADRRLFRIEWEAFHEALAVMRRLGVEAVDFPDYPARKLAMLMSALPRMLARRILHRKVGAARGSKQPSLRIEMERARPVTEVAWLNGAVVRQGATLGLSTPANAFLADTLTAIVQGDIPWDIYRGQPPRLWTDFTRARGAGG